MKHERRHDITLCGCKLIHKNFRGIPGEYNPNGEKRFSVVIEDEELVRQMEEEGWYIKYKPEDENGYRRPFLDVKVTYGQYPPVAVLITDYGKMRLDEETIGQLDWTVIRNCDLVITPYHHGRKTKNGSTITAYMKAIYVTKEERDEDILERKYHDIPYMDDENDDAEMDQDLEDDGYQE